MTAIAPVVNPLTPTDHEPIVRLPAVAGRFYSAAATTLTAEVKRFLAVDGPPRLRQVRAVVAPHAGYACSGEVAGAAYRSIAKEPPIGERTVYLLGPAHWKPVHGVGLTSATAFQTPLGIVPVDVERVRELAVQRDRYHMDDAAHAPEHCLEVQLPFLQMIHSAFRIVPLLFDDGADPVAVADDICHLLEEHPNDLIVTTTDLSHYHPYQDAIILDHAFLKALATGDLEAANAGEACGLLPILCLMHIAQRLNWRPHLLAYANSGDTCGSRREVVGYGAVAYTA